ncbi:MAG TPA: hypothetical protein VMV94_07465 [Phycisphaerae bacterium]|nr:hypothetical protein [Phycisphaerae bacterium]
MAARRDDCFTRQCRFFRGWREDKRLAQPGRPVLKFVCEAFPEGVPDDIRCGDDPHTTPRPGNHGIVYQRAADDEWARILSRL